MGIKNLLCATFLLPIFFTYCNAFADIYRYVDEKGTVHFSNVPSDSRFKLYLSTSRYYTKYNDIIKEMSAKYKVDSDLVRAVIKAESNYNPLVVSQKGAQGLMQLMPETALDMKVKNVFNPKENIEGGVKYLRRLLTTFDNDLPLTLAAYNAGENIVKENNYKIPPYKETQDYVKKVLLYLQEYKKKGI